MPFRERVRLGARIDDEAPGRLEVGGSPGGQ